MKIVIINLLILTFIIANLFPGAFSEDANKYLESNGKTLFVGGSGPGNYSNIQDAIDNASDGDTVYVYSGTYPTSSIYIEKAIQLIGENRNITIVESSSNVEIYIKPNSHNVAISNFTFQNFRVETHQNNNISISDNIFLTTIYYGNPSVIDSSGSYNTFKGNTIILRHTTTEEECGPKTCMRSFEYHSTIVNNTLVGATSEGLIIGGTPFEDEQYGLNTVTGNTFSNNGVGLFLSTDVTSIGKNLITQNNFINNSLQAGFTIMVLHPFDLIKVISTHHKIPFSQWDGNYWDDYTGHLGRKIPGKMQFFSTRFIIPVRNVDRHPAPGPIYPKKELVSTTSDITSYVLEKYSERTLTWGDWWPDFPERYESFFEVKDIIDFGQTARGLTTTDFNKDGLLDFAVSWATDPWTRSTISIFYNDGDGGFTRDDVYTITTPFVRSISDLNSGDYDNDGDIDLLFTYSESINQQKKNGTVNLLVNNGLNNFIDCILVTRLLPTEGGERRINPQVSSADFDDDGDIDFLVGDNSGLVEFYRNNESGIFTGAGIYDFGGGMSWGLSSADFDGDGDIDFIVTQGIDPFYDDGYILLVPNSGTEECFNQSDYVQIAVLPPRLSFYAGPIAGFGCLCTMDYNDDGRIDFLFSGGDSLFLYMQNVTGGFDYFTVCRLPGVNVGNGTYYADQLREGAIATGDFNGDGLDDLVVGGVQGMVRLFINQRMLVDIVFPDREGIIIQNEYKLMLLPFYFALMHGTSFAFGKITVVAKEIEPLQKVEFYLGNRLMYTDDADPYEWNWTSLSFGRYKIKAVPYDLDGKQAGSDDAIVWKFF